jgi:coiled-coil domain-containing protein 12
MSDADRRARLQALRAAAAAEGQVEEGGEAGGAGGAGAGGPAADEPVLRFRNYVVKDQKGIEHIDVAPPRVAPIGTVLAAAAPKAAEAGAATATTTATAAAAAPPPPVDQLDAEALLAGAAKSANADLKREIAPKLAKLERQTARAMLNIMREEERQRHVAAGGAAD